MRFILLFLGCLFLSAAPTGSLINSPSAPTVVIDIGHGGQDRGTKAGNPYCEEKKVTLLTGRLVKQYLEQLGYHVVMTRSADHFISLPQRVEIANQAQANIFVSIHYNSSRSPEANGIEIFFFDSKENKTRANASRKLADTILTQVIRKTSAHSRGVKKGNYYVIRETSMPAVLVEGGFISNQEERSLLKTRDYQEKIAEGIADGIDRYFKARWRKAIR
ncbi:MAG: N-acetylmuramoyl-L-alanine amidase [Verrucomicrobia bacterium]|nr:N-acetylmuramoyl-L-alanine amidase [Verrucomicrobiota bacterium]MBU6446153.1 N-acetylmuramoyl-L-alanine amidase [Verrucomicrobiota bacterium]MDE3046966.1 N-acetylmuramoyl-L-alanine amidase [Verrucomicrobiota bacterium]